jgi:hypothetical protein
MKSHKDYYWLEDKEERQGELTDRGLFFATMDENKYNVAKEIFLELC